LQPIGGWARNARRLACRLPLAQEAAIAIRIQLGDVPAMLGDIVVQLLAESFDVEIVGHSDAGDDALDDARAAHADLLIVREGGGGAARKIFEQPGLNILSIDGDGRQGALVRLAQERLMLDQDRLRAIATEIVGDVAGHA
jgi:DNA-binding NarL/FixJ family response regulator